MMVFKWSGEETSFYFSIISTIKGVLGFACNLGFTFGILSRVSERKSVVLALLLMLLFYLITYPWPMFYSHPIAYGAGNGGNISSSSSGSMTS
jgi:hypothetical protein